MRDYDLTGKVTVTNSEPKGLLDLIDYILERAPECYSRSYNWRDGCKVCCVARYCRKIPLFVTLDRETAERDMKKQRR